MTFHILEANVTCPISILVNVIHVCIAKPVNVTSTETFPGEANYHFDQHCVHKLQPA